MESLALSRIGNVCHGASVKTGSSSGKFFLSSWVSLDYVISDRSSTTERMVLSVSVFSVLDSSTEISVVAGLSFPHAERSSRERIRHTAIILLKLNFIIAVIFLLFYFLIFLNSSTNILS